MFTIEVELLTGRYAASAHDDRRRAEWPPHPARLFSALVAAHYENDAPRLEERKALLWLESQPAPSLRVTDQIGRRDVRDVYVPVNDVSVIGDLERPLRESRAALEKAIAEQANKSLIKKATKALEEKRLALLAAIEKLSVPDAEPVGKTLATARALLPERRTRQMRTFPVVVPHDPRIVFMWNVELPTEICAALRALCDRVTRLGHSSSLVWCRVTTTKVEPTLVPRPDGELVLRTVGPGQLDRLDAAFAEHRGLTGRVLPALPQRYGRPVSAARKAPPRSVFGPDWIVFERVGGAMLMGSRAVDVTRALRAALLEQHGRPGLSPVLSGHQADGSAAKTPHVAFVALPWVGHEHADGTIKGLAVVPPADFSADDREELFRLIASWEKRQPGGVVTLAALGLPPVRFKRVEVASTESARSTRWSRPARHFVTATPIALDRHPGNLRSNLENTAHKAAAEARTTIAAACELIGLPRPSAIEISVAPLLRGAQPSAAYLAARPGRPQRVRVHAELRFEEPVCGPLLLGAGRHFGLGLCLPIGGTDDSF